MAISKRIHQGKSIHVIAAICKFRPLDCMEKITSRWMKVTITKMHNKASMGSCRCHRKNSLRISTMCHANRHPGHGCYRQRLQPLHPHWRKVFVLHVTTAPSQPWKLNHDQGREHCLCCYCCCCVSDIDMNVPEFIIMSCPVESSQSSPRSSPFA